MPRERDRDGCRDCAGFRACICCHCAAKCELGHVALLGCPLAGNAYVLPQRCCNTMCGVLSTVYPFPDVKFYKVMVRDDSPRNSQQFTRPATLWCRQPGKFPWGVSRCNSWVLLVATRTCPRTSYFQQAGSNSQPMKSPLGTSHGSSLCKFSSEIVIQPAIAPVSVKIEEELREEVRMSFRCGVNRYLAFCMHALWMLTIYGIHFQPSHRNPDSRGSNLTFFLLHCSPSITHSLCLSTSHPMYRLLREVGLSCHCETTLLT